jgi:hypothetical protein
MSDTSASHPGSEGGAGGESGTGSENGTTATQESIWMRLLYMLCFWFLGNIAFSLSVFLGVVQFVVILVSGRKNEELRQFSRNLIQFVWECLAFIVFAREEKPFPFGKFPSVSPGPEA